MRKSTRSPRHFRPIRLRDERRRQGGRLPGHPADDQLRGQVPHGGCRRSQAAAVPPITQVVKRLQDLVRNSVADPWPSRRAFTDSLSSMRLTLGVLPDIRRKSGAETVPSSPGCSRSAPDAIAEVRYSSPGRGSSRPSQRPRRLVRLRSTERWHQSPISPSTRQRLQSGRPASGRRRIMTRGPGSRSEGSLRLVKPPWR